ncbi:hypothetical protein SJS82_21625, partial [Aeromonas media]|nr:hypothetical protein [Aeromonas media]
ANPTYCRTASTPGCYATLVALYLHSGWPTSGWSPPGITPEDAQLIADQVLFVDEGRIALQGKPDILQDSEHPGLLRYLGRALSP